MLDRIDLYGGLELTPAEMPQFLTELDVLLGNAQNFGERDVIRAVRELAERCRDDEDTRLAFIGD